MRYCCVVGCENRLMNSFTPKLQKKRGISFHSFPRQKKRRQKWIENLGREKFVLCKYTSVCSQHFLQEMFDRTGPVVRLKENAIPTLLEHSNLQNTHLRNQTIPNSLASGAFASSMDISLQPVVRVKRLEGSSPEVMAGPELDKREQKAVNELTQKRMKWKLRATNVGQKHPLKIANEKICVSDALRPVVERSSRAVVLCSKLNAEDMYGRIPDVSRQSDLVKIGRDEICVSDALRPVLGRNPRAIVLCSKLEDENGKENYVSSKQKHQVKIGNDKIHSSETSHPVVRRSSRANVLCIKMEDEDRKENQVSRNSLKVKQEHHVKVGRDELSVSEISHPVVRRSSRAMALCNKLEDGKENHVFITQKHQMKTENEENHVSKTLHPTIGHCSRAIVMCCKLEDDDVKRNLNSNVKTKSACKVELSRKWKTRESLRSHRKSLEKLASKEPTVKTECVEHKNNLTISRKTKSASKKRKTKERSHIKTSKKCQSTSRGPIVKTESVEHRDTLTMSCKTKSASRKRKTKESVESHKKSVPKKLASKKQAINDPSMEITFVEENGMLYMRYIPDFDSKPESSIKRKTKERSSPEKLASQEWTSEQQASKKSTFDELVSEEQAVKISCIDENGILYTRSIPNPDGEPEISSKKKTKQSVQTGRKFLPKNLTSEKPACVEPAANTACDEGNNDALYMTCEEGENTAQWDNNGDEESETGEVVVIKEEMDEPDGVLDLNSLIKLKLKLKTTHSGDLHQDGQLQNSLDKFTHSGDLQQDGQLQNLLDRSTDSEDLQQYRHLQNSLDKSSHSVNLQQDGHLQNLLDKSTHSGALQQDGHLQHPTLRCMLSEPAPCSTLSESHNTYLWEMFSGGTKSVDLDKQKATSEETFKHCRTCSCAKENIPLTPGFHPAVPVPTAESRHCFRCYTQDYMQVNCATMCQICDKYFCFSSERNCLVLYHYGSL